MFYPTNNYQSNTQKYYPEINNKKKNTSIITIIFSSILSPFKIKKADEITIKNNLRGGKKYIVASKISGKDGRRSYTRKEIQYAYPLNRRNLTKLVKSLNYGKDTLVDNVLTGLSTPSYNSYPQQTQSYSFKKNNVIDVKPTQNKTYEYKNNYSKKNTSSPSVKKKTYSSPNISKSDDKNLLKAYNDKFNVKVDEEAKWW